MALSCKTQKIYDFSLQGRLWPVQKKEKETEPVRPPHELLSVVKVVDNLSLK